MHQESPIIEMFDIEVLNVNSGKQLALNIEHCPKSGPSLQSPRKNFSL